MNRKYTLEDVEYIRSRASVTYDEAIGLLDAYEGDVVRVMAELERSGKLRSVAGTDSSPWETIKTLFRKGYEHRMVVSKGSRTIANFSIIFWFIVIVFAFYITIPALIFAILFGYKINFRHEAGASKDFQDIAVTAKENIKKAANTIRDEFKDGEVKGDAQNAGQSGVQESQNPDIIIE